jgi:hypothetical protein
MPEAPLVPSPALRAIEAISQDSGRTLVIAGPPASGKSKLLAEVRLRLQGLGARIITLEGSYRGRTVPYGALDGLRASALSPEPETPEESADPPLAVDIGSGPLGALPLSVEPIAGKGRRRRGGRGRRSFLGTPLRERSANEGDPDAYWAEILPEFRGPSAHPVAILIEDGGLFDDQSREFIVTLSRRAPLRPLLIALTLDTSVPDARLWEERFLGHGEVDWVRLSTSAPDPREVQRVKSLFDELPEATQNLLGVLTLLGGDSGEVVLARVARLRFSQLAETLLPATRIGLARVREGRAELVPRSVTAILKDLLSESSRRRIHAEIADALLALSPEPIASRRIEIARHLFLGDPGAGAARRLIEAAEISFGLQAYDSAAELLEEAVNCLPAMPNADRANVEPELRLLHARTLFCAGRPTEAEAELREGIEAALRAGLPSHALAELVEPLLLTMRAVGPRPSLTMTQLELAERAQNAGLPEVELLFETFLADFYLERNQGERSRTAALRAAQIAHSLRERHLQAFGLLAMGFSRIVGSSEEQAKAERFLRAARHLFGSARRWELDHLAGEYEARLLEARGEALPALHLRRRSVSALEREKLIDLELGHEVGIAELLLDEGAGPGAAAALVRARTIVQTLHLVPPSPGLLRLWLLEGRTHALAGETSAARDAWEAIADLPEAKSIPAIRAEALVRLALLERALDRSDAAEARETELAAPAVASALRPSWRRALGRIADIAPASELGGGRFPPGPAQTGTTPGTAAKSPGSSP